MTHKMELSRRHSQFVGNVKAKHALTRHPSISMEDLIAQQRALESCNERVNLPQHENISFYDRPHCACPKQVCSHTCLEGPSIAYPVGPPEGIIAKDPSLVYDLPGSASLTDELAINLKQQRFFMEQLQKQGKVKEKRDGPGDTFIVQ